MIGQLRDGDVVVVDAMELPDIYRRSSGRLHTSSDGQKFEIRTESLNANYSFKYFGKGRGVSAYTFIDERNLLWYSLVFSASERESAYVIDGLMHNDVVDSDVHSADSHGYTEVIFGITHLLGVSYALRIADLDQAAVSPVPLAQRPGRRLADQTRAVCERSRHSRELGRLPPLSRDHQAQGRQPLPTSSAGSILFPPA
ncbi:MAG: Tn3 family transposase [Geminicoccaceae bacterium]